MGESRFLRIYLPISVFINGMVILMLEITSSKLIAPYFGNSIFVWANLIGFTLAFLTIGYYVGGKIADKKPELKVYSLILLCASLYIIPMPFFIGPLQKFLIKAMPELAALILSIFAILAVPCILMGGISPFSIKLLLNEVEKAGELVGYMYAISTIGGIIGAIAPVILGIPNIGTRWTILIFNFFLLITALIGLKNLLPLAIACLLLLIGIGVEVSYKVRDPSIILEKETPYAYYTVKQNTDGSRILLVNDLKFFYSVWREDKLLVGNVLDVYLLAPYFLPVEKGKKIKEILILGLAGGTSVRQLNKIYKHLKFDGVEIDPGVVEIGKKYFSLNEPNLTIYVMDARRYLENTEKKYDIIIMDMYVGDMVPPHLITKEFFKLSSLRLNPDGIVVVNFPPELRPGYPTIKSVFKTAYIASQVHIASNSEDFSVENLYKNAPLIENPEVREFVMDYSKNKLAIWQMERKLPPITDDRTPLILR